MNYKEKPPTKRDLQQKINSTAKRNTALTNDWLRDNGLNDHTFTNVSLNIARATAMANTLLTQHRDLLSKRDIHALTDFQQAASNKRDCKHITDSFCYCVMNINTRINRAMFKQYRKQNQHVTA